MPRRHLLGLSILALATLGQAPAPPSPPPTGTVVGRVETFFAGKPIKLDEVWVFVESTRPPRISTGKGETATVPQQATQFRPRVTVIPIGATVFFPNLDPFEHNVFSPAIRKWLGFDLGRYNRDRKGKSKDFLELGEFDIYCDIHPSMKAKVKVVPTRHFTKVVGGRFRLDDVPVGSYKLVAWTPDSLEVRSQLFEVTANATAAIETLHLQYQQPKATHRRKDGNHYGPYRQGP